MTIKGTLLDANNNNPIPGATFSVYYSGNMTGPPNATFTSDANGNYVYTDGSLDTASDPAISVQANGYLQGIGSPGFWNGTSTLQSETVTETVIPAWVWVAIAVLGVLGFLYLNKKYKLI